MRSYSSMFLGHDRHTYILNHFVGMAKEFKSECLYQISMDGLTVNMKFLNMNIKTLWQNSKLRIILHFMTLVVSLSTLCMVLFGPVPKNLNGP